MRIAYFDCSTGISGDMTLAALVDAGADFEAIRAAIDSLGLDGVSIEMKTVVKNGFRARSMQITHPEQHAHRHLGHINAILEGADGLTPNQKSLARRFFVAVAEAEAKVHGATVDSVHFHEVGAIDSIVDIVGVAVAFDLLEIKQAVFSPVPTGRGQIKIAHGICTVPAPGTAELLKGIPLTDVPVEAELTTPTGAAFVKVLADRFGALPEMTVEQIGYGAGNKTFPERANVLRVFVGSRVASPEYDQVTVLETNLDDVSGEVIGYTKEKLLTAGALDVYTVPVQMKKNRPGVVFTVLSPNERAEQLEQVLFQETGTLGIRRHLVERSKRPRAEATVETPWGTVLGKVSLQRNGEETFSPEFEDCARVASEHNVALRDVYRAAESAYLQQHPASIIGPSTKSIDDEPHDHKHDHDHSHDHSQDHHHDHSHDHDHHH